MQPVRVKLPPEEGGGSIGLGVGRCLAKTIVSTISMFEIRLVCGQSRRSVKNSKINQRRCFWRTT